MFFYHKKHVSSTVMEVASRTKNANAKIVLLIKIRIPGIGLFICFSTKTNPNGRDTIAIKSKIVFFNFLLLKNCSHITHKYQVKILEHESCANPNRMGEEIVET